MKEGAVDMVDGFGEGSSEELVPSHGDNESALQIVVGRSSRLIKFDARCGTCSMLCSTIVCMPFFNENYIFMLPRLATQRGCLFPTEMVSFTMEGL
jgi:hypothetical protein